MIGMIQATLPMFHFSYLQIQLMKEIIIKVVFMYLPESTLCPMVLLNIRNVCSFNVDVVNYQMMKESSAKALVSRKE